MRLGLELRLFLLLLIAVASGGTLAALVLTGTDSLAAAICTTVLLAAPMAWVLARRGTRPLRRLLRALSAAVANYRDGDFSISLAVERQDEFGDLLEAHNELGTALREQRQQLVQRELLLDTVAQ